jgi:hypothetical protein
VDEGVVLIVFSYISDEKGINATINVNEAPELVKYRFVESDPQDYLLEHVLAGSRYHKHC